MLTQMTTHIIETARIQKLGKLYIEDNIINSQAKNEDGHFMVNDNTVYSCGPIGT